jgi:hypothetical protein
MARLIKASDSKAFRVEAVEINGNKQISIRQMYRKKGQEEWQHAKQGVNLDLEGEVAVRVARAVRLYATDDATEFKEVVIERRKKGGDDE